MLLLIVMASLSLLIAIINIAAVTRTKRTERLTDWGYALIVLSVAVFVISVWKIRQDNEHEASEPFRLTEFDNIQPKLSVSLVNSAPSPDLDEETPKVIPITIVIPQEGAWNCTLEGTGFFNPASGHGPPTALKIYQSNNCTPMDNLKVKYVWDLAGKKVQVRNPKSFFSDISPTAKARSWHSELILRVKRRNFNPLDPAAPTLVFSFEGQDRNSWLVSSGS